MTTKKRRRWRKDTEMRLCGKTSKEIDFYVHRMLVENYSGRDGT